MDRSTTKKEYKAFMRKWRSVVANINPAQESWKREKFSQDQGWGIAFQAVYKLIPTEFWLFQAVTDHKIYRDITDPHPSICMKMNTEGFCANSYPHKTRNP